MKEHYWKDGVFEADMSDLIGRVFTAVSGGKGDYELSLTCAEGVFTFHHEQDCCESVLIEDITGDLSDLIGEPILVAEESTNSDEPVPSEYSESFLWTFYKLATRKGYVDIRWLGESNGYYSESVSLKFVPTTTEVQEAA